MYYINIDGFADSEGREIIAILAVPALSRLGRAQVLAPSLRNYIASNYDNIRNSAATITIREAEYAAPTAIATYSYGIERRLNLTKKSEADIEKLIAGLEADSQSIASEIKI